jgi:hypothetical protein
VQTVVLGEYTFSVARTTHYMSTVEAAFVTPVYSAGAAGSQYWCISALSSSTGRASFITDDNTLNKAGTVHTLLIGSPHTTYIAD